MPVGVQAQAVEVPPSTTSTYNTQNAFMPALADWGPVGQAIPTTNLQNAAAQLGTPSGSTSAYGPRTSTSATVIDAADTLFQEDGQAQPILYVSRVTGPNPVYATLTLQDATPTAAIDVSAKYVGAGGNGIYVGVTNNGTTASITLFDQAGNTLASSGALGTVAALVAWLNTTSLVTATAGTGQLPVTLAATALTGGTDDRAHVTVTQLTAALDALPPSLGPGQVLAPNWTNTDLSGAWSAIGNHAFNNNRVAICDMADGQNVSTLATNLGTYGQSTVGSYSGMWAGDRQIPGVIVNTSRSVHPSPVIAGLCARADQVSNPSAAAAGINYALTYATAPNTLVSGAPYDTYSQSDLNALNAIGINTFQRVNGLPTNYGFVTPVLSAQDAIYWQFSHARLRMFIIAQAQLIGQPFVFSLLDGAGADQLAFQSAIEGNILDPLGGALYGGYTVDVGPDINTPATIAAGQLNARITCSFSYFVQDVTFLVNVQPITTLA